MLPKYTGKDRWYKTSDKQYVIVKCDNCWLEKIDPTPSREEQQSFYPTDYYSYAQAKGGSSQKTLFSKIVEKILNKMRNKTFSLDYFYEGDHLGKSFLDIGCGSGITLQQMTSRGRDSYWFEFWSQQTLKNNIYYDSSLVHVDFKGRTFDVISLFHVFEHLDDPIGYLEKIRKISHKDTKIMIVLPSVNSVSSKIRGKYAAERDIPRHLYNYTPLAIHRLLEQQWFAIHKHQMMENYGVMSMKWRAKNALGIELGWWKIFFLWFALLFDMMLTLTKSTNQMGIICKIK